MFICFPMCFDTITTAATASGKKKVNSNTGWFALSFNLAQFPRPLRHCGHLFIVFYRILSFLLSFALFCSPCHGDSFCTAIPPLALTRHRPTFKIRVSNIRIILFQTNRLFYFDYFRVDNLFESIEYTRLGRTVMHTNLTRGSEYVVPDDENERIR